MRASFLIGLLAGLTSIVLYLGTASGNILGFMLAFIAPLPIFVVGLGWGSRAALIAGLAASALFAVAGALAPRETGGWLIGVVYFLTTGGAPIWLSRLALLRRNAAEGTASDAFQWYPAGQILLWAAGLTAAGLIVVMLSAYRVDPAGLSGLLRQAIEITIPPGSELRTLLLTETGVKDWDTLAASMARTVPATAGMVWQAMMIANALLAHKILTASKHTIRPAIGWQTLTLPRLLLPLLAVAFGATFAGGAIGLMAGTIGAVLFVPYFFLGLTVVHAIPARGAGRVVLLGLIYFMLLVLISPAILIGILGLIEQWTGLRARLLTTARRENG